ncbi:hypothetical protein [Nocardioides perillae]|uniref:Uncharacterized protein n=1 Tax=Nocardioides perillae TaxID=1119534 RepID=A0A7Y9UL55_9ACTN|nr:hypothetical protein [Nocardioides perillae]NYG54026.1 hypothetical protein [Nocardioides perillae]
MTTLVLAPLAAVVLAVLALLVLYAVVRVAVHHGVRDADRSRERDALGRDDGAALRASIARAQRRVPDDPLA